MSTSTPENASLVSDVLAELDAADQFETPPEGGATWKKWVFRLVLLGVVAGLGAFGVVQLAGSFESRGTDAWLTHVAKRGELLVTIVEDGNLESSQNVDIKCEVAGGSTVLSIIEDGKEVQEGADLVKLDSAQLEDQINQQKINYEKARAAHIQSSKDYEVAKISVPEYQEGNYRQQLQDLEAKVTIAMENLRSAENSLQHTQRMFRKGYVSPLQLETQQFAVERSKLDGESAKTAKDVLERFTKVKTLQDLESKRDTAEAKKNSDKAAFDLEEARLKRLETQLKKCIIRAPKAGMVVYANEQSHGRFAQQTSEIKEGAVVREQQAILRLPDLSKMQVKVTVHESKVDRLRRGMRARIRIQDREFQGTVISVANQPEPGGFMSAAVKEYATIVKLEGDTKGLRPGMTAEVEILVAHLKDVLSVPVAAIYEQRGVTFCCVKDGPKVEKRTVELGMTNDKYVEIRSGLKEGVEVVLNPRDFFTETKEESRQPEALEVAEKFGNSKGDPGSMTPGAGPGAVAKKSRPGEGGKQGSKGPGGRGGFDLAQFDKDGDGKISRDEAPEQIRDFFDKLDTNGDGFIDRAEMSAMRARGRGKGAGGPGDPPGGTAGGGPPAP
jgi:HlyD family secretion protein